ncbi:MAG: sigma-54-dependent Fis family transcriptional regulator [Neptuniibacter sp.]
MYDFKRSIAQTRIRFFEEQDYNYHPDDLIRHSWKYCLTKGLKHKEKLIFTPISRASLKQLQDQEKHLIDCFNEVIHINRNTIKRADYLVVLTNSNGIALNIQGDLKKHDHETRHTFRPGICFSEEQIGTNAMGCAINFRQEISIIGGEHFIESISGFQCSAAPILDHNGTVLGTVDLSRSSNKLDCGAKLLASTISMEIEKKLFLQQDGFIKLELNLAHDFISVKQNNTALLLSFDADGFLLSSCARTRSRLDLERINSPISFEDIFYQSFDELVTTQSRQPPVSLNLRSGLNVLVKNFFCERPVSQMVAQEEKAPTPLPDFGDPAIEKQLNRGLSAVAANLPILISGETGTGKEVFAQTIFKQCLLKGPIIALNCSAIPENLIESELFGYEEGAFTGARKGGARGKIEQANEGILFLDEIGDMPLAQQAQLLRVLDTGEVTRLGSEKKRISHFQLLSASHRDLLEAVGQGTFRQDLYYRIKGLNLYLSPLRKRPYLKRFITELAKQTLDDSFLSPEALNKLCSYDWPGNVRELINSLKVLKVFSNKPVINVHDLPSEMFSYDIKRHSKGSLPDLEHRLIIDALIKHNGHVPSAALDLRLSRATLYRKIQSLKINVDEFRINE